MLIFAVDAVIMSIIIVIMIIIMIYIYIYIIPANLHPPLTVKMKSQ